MCEAWPLPRTIYDQRPRVTLLAAWMPCSPGCSIGERGRSNVASARSCERSCVLYCPSAWRSCPKERSLYTYWRPRERRFRHNMELASGARSDSQNRPLPYASTQNLLFPPALQIFCMSVVVRRAFFVRTRVGFDLYCWSTAPTWHGSLTCVDYTCSPSSETESSLLALRSIGDAFGRGLRYTALRLAGV